MAFNRTASPVLTMPPGAAHQTSFGMPTYSQQAFPLSHSPAFGAPILAQSSVAPSSGAGRKRSRDEAAVNLDVEEAKTASIEPIESIKESEDDWIYGEGMTLIKSPSAYVSEAGNQSGTWVEEKVAEEQARKVEEATALHEQQRPSLRSNKSQRLDMAAQPILVQEPQINRSSPVRDAGTPTLSADTSHQPVVDNFTLHLGIGWRRISDDEHIQAAARGWARYIENHYPVSNVQIQLESKGLQSYLIEASEGYFLFAEDLRHGQLVSKDLNRAFGNLKQSPPIFDGAEVMSAAESPKPLEAFPDPMVSQKLSEPASTDIDMAMS